MQCLQFICRYGGLKYTLALRKIICVINKIGIFTQHSDLSIIPQKIKQIIGTQGKTVSDLVVSKVIILIFKIDQFFFYRRQRFTAKLSRGTEISHTCPASTHNHKIFRNKLQTVLFFSGICNQVRNIKATILLKLSQRGIKCENLHQGFTTRFPCNPRIPYNITRDHSIDHD